MAWGAIVRAVLYARVSTEEQTEGYSLDAQIGRCREYCKTQGWEVVSEYIDAGFSGRSVRRPQFEQMMRDAEAGLFDVLVIHKLDRFSRILRDTITYLGQLADHGIGFVSIQEHFDYTTPSGRLQMHILAALAQWYSENLGQEIKKGLSQRAREGLWLGNLPTGYCLGLCSECEDHLCPNMGQEERGDGRIPIVHPVDSEGVRKLFELYATGQYSYNSVARELTRLGYQMNTRWGRRLWIGDTVKKAITSPIYLGYLTYKGQRFPGKQHAIVSQDSWDRCQEIRIRNRRRARIFTPKFRTYLFRGMLVCEGCGKAMTGETSRSGVSFYRCMSYFKQIPCTAPRWRVHESGLEEQIRQIITRLELPSDWRSRIEELVNAREETRNIEQEQTRLQEKLRRLQNLYLEVLIGEEELRRGKAEVQAALANLNPPPRAKIDITADQLKTMRMAWEGATKKERSEILSTLFQAVYCDPGQKRLVALKPKLAFLPLFREIEILKENGEKFEMKYD